MLVLRRLIYPETMFVGRLKHYGKKEIFYLLSFVAAANSFSISSFHSPKKTLLPSLI